MDTCVELASDYNYVNSDLQPTLICIFNSSLRFLSLHPIFIMYFSDKFNVHKYYISDVCDTHTEDWFIFCVTSRTLRNMTGTDIIIFLFIRIVLPLIMIIRET